MPQQNLFEIEPVAAWEDDDARERLVASVIFPSAPDRPFDYLVPDDMRDRLTGGMRVRAPFGRGNRAVVGYCVRLTNQADVRRKLKPLADVIDRQSLLSPAMLRLTEWMAGRYLSTWGQALETVLPAAVRERAGTRRVKLISLAPDAAGRIGELKLSEKQAAIVRFLSERGAPVTPKELTTALNCTAAPIGTLQRKGIVTVESRIAAPDEARDPPAPREPNHVLNDDQRLALEAMLAAIHSGRQETLLVHGVTGSGKTEVYIQAIQEVVRFGRQAIVLVPEISLTPQTRERFRARFDQVAVLHSHLREAERHLHWQRIARGEVSVVVGARSAAFAPIPNLGLIVMDEEHESTFKQETTPRYHAREVALWRAKSEGIPLILGSATPSLESWYRAQQGEFRLIEMPRRVFDRPMPLVGTIDLRDEFHNRRTRGAVGRQMHQAIDAALRDGGQVILLLNRRGFSTHIQCPKCGMVVRCPNCELALTHHRQGELAICHYCDYRTAAPRECPECSFPGIQYAGVGTQKLEAEIASRFPQARILRMDTDTMQSHGAHAKALDAFRDGKVDILLGTQMIAKGLDFPRVTLVGVINADTALHLPDFRAAERTFQLVTQVAGRTGRGEHGGRVLVQTFSPDHPAIRAAVRHDYPMFARQELPIREALLYPPYSEMVRIIVRGPDGKATKEFAAELAERFKVELGQVATAWRMLGPAPAPIAKLRGLQRFHVQLQATDGEKLRAVVRDVMSAAPRNGPIQWTADVDPLDMM
ncbi:MAG TPA: primosomal protein N' [Pirellulales bacterium]|jgi:primosomal protein N' (replication factor Y)|nr:primosomal protein N' [Pirellulales bacterium]